ncbi:hypothetical protein [Helicobacter sp. 13S00477-4]|uniref:hypothetical protein n=1 Tax=Helicobacter sp. 13S00477-4 TaxID=1905759 RepID=UPI000BA792DF|nr:hypothetical protein [Helicobacter sp. 13S00477-4]PAF52121.1 hypothetical protein BKH44_04420 [Helicobacter sp. 13S00477-4]
MESDFGETCRKNGFPTRIINYYFEIEYEKYSQKCEDEYLKLCDGGYDSFDNWLTNLKTKNRGDNDVVLEVLAEIYKKLQSLENLIKHQDQKLIPLENKNFAMALGHGIICAEKSIFELEEEYYLRFKLPIFPERYIGVFGRAFEERIVKITKMHQKDTKDFDMFIANREIENLRTQHRKDI